MSEVVFIVSGDALDAENLAQPLRDRGWRVETETRDPAAVCARVGECRTVAIVVSLAADDGDSGCDLACALSIAAAVDSVPVLFVGGDAEAEAAALAVRPDAEFVSPDRLTTAIKRISVS